MIDTGSPWLFALATGGMFCIFGTSYGPTASFLPEIFAKFATATPVPGWLFNLAAIVGGACAAADRRGAGQRFRQLSVGALMAVRGGQHRSTVVCRSPETKGKYITGFTTRLRWPGQATRQFDVLNDPS